MYATYVSSIYIYTTNIREWHSVVFISLHRNYVSFRISFVICDSLRGCTGVPVSTTLKNNECLVNLFPISLSTVTVLLISLNIFLKYFASSLQF